MRRGGALGAGVVLHRKCRNSRKRQSLFARGEAQFSIRRPAIKGRSPTQKQAHPLSGTIVADAARYAGLEYLPFLRKRTCPAGVPVSPLVAQPLRLCPRAANGCTATIDKVRLPKCRTPASTARAAWPCQRAWRAKAGRMPALPVVACRGRQAMKNQSGRARPRRLCGANAWDVGRIR